MKNLISIFLILVTYHSFSQHPAYYLFGEEHFKGIDIYDVIQDEEYNYLFATGQGLIKHDGYSYENLECPEMKGSSVFGFAKDTKGVIYCLNLHHQIFRITSGKMEVYYELPPESQSPDISIAVDHNDNLIIQSRVTTFISPNKTSIKIIEENSNQRTGTPSGIMLLPNGAAISGLPSPYLLYIENKKVSLLDSVYSDLPAQYKIEKGLFWTVLDGRVIGIQASTLNAFEFNPQTKKVEFVKRINAGNPTQFLRLYGAQNKLWINSHNTGTIVLDKNLNTLYNETAIYPDYFISDIFTDHEGNLLLSTFDEGVIVVPGKSVHGVSLPNREKITKLESCEDGLFIGSNSGNVYQLTNKNSLLKFSTNQSKNAVEGLFFWKVRNAIIRNKESKVELTELATKKSSTYPSGSLKDACFLSPEIALLAFNQGLYRWKINTKENQLTEYTKLFKGRTYSVSYAEKDQLIYVGTSSGLRIIDHDGNSRIAKINGKSIFANQIMCLDEKIIVGTRKHGILIYDKGEITRVIPFQESIRDLILHENKIFILTRHGIYHGNFNRDEFTKLNRATGLDLKNVVDFEIANDVLYVTNSSRIQYIKLKNLYTSNISIPIRFTNILVNGKKTQQTSFEHDQSNFVFQFSVSTLRFRENVKYAYKLEGKDKEWKYLPYKNNQVEFSFLPPGKYNFTVKAINGLSASEPIQYSFSINAPFYQRWWFYVFIFLLSGLIIGIVFSYRIRLLSKRNTQRLEKQKIQTELLETELKALRSQMNPHFIFNSLNSIQDLILKEDTDASYDYIVLFADLVRSALNYSNKDFIPIEKELEFLDVYLSLEKLRFKEEFEYSITFNGDENIKVPSMLIQPFIENALLHGLLHKNGKKTLDITFDFDSKLICTIQDNGVGRKKAAIISKRQGGHHESFALDAINKRLSIFNARQGSEIGKYTIEDLYPEREETGTKVKIYVPFERQY